MKTKHLHFYLLLLFVSLIGTNKGFSQIVISGYLANPGGSDSSFEYVQLVATQDIDFSTNPYTVAWCNNGTATVKGWVRGGSVTYGFGLTSGSVLKGDVFYVGGAMKRIDGNGSTDISSATWISTKYTGSQSGDGFGTPSTTGSLGNGGSADGIAVFSFPANNIDSATIPIDVVFFGDSIGSSKPASGGYTVANNDWYSTSQGTFGNGNNTYLFPTATASDKYFSLSGTYDLSTGTWASPRTASAIILSSTSVLADITSAITLYTPTPVVMINSMATSKANVIQGSIHNPSYQLICDVLTLPADLDSIKFKTYGSFYSGDIKSYGFKLWYSKYAVFNSSDSLIDSADAAGPGDLWFRNTKFHIPVNTTAHFFVTIDISALATLGDSIYFDSLMISNIYFAVAQKSGASKQPRSGILTIVSTSAPLINATFLNIFSNQPVNTTSPEQMYMVTAANLFPSSGNIVITPPAGFAISLTSGSGYVSSSLTIPYTLGELNPTEVYVVFKPTLIAQYNGYITHIGGSATQNLQVTGYGISSDTTAPKVDTAYAINANIVLVIFSEAIDSIAENTTSYTVFGGVTTAVRDASLKTVTLTLTTPLIKGIPQILGIQNIADTSSNHNVMIPQNFELFIPAEQVINELLAKSATSDEFIEIFNPNLTKSISLKGYHLTNDSTSLLKWAFPDTSITAGGYLVVWDNQHPANPGLHCNFTLNNAAREVVLRSNSNSTVAYTKFPIPKSDTSWGRIPNGSGPFTFTKPTPGAVNKLYPKPIPVYSIAQIRANSATGEPDSAGVYCKVTGIVYGVNFSTYGYSFTVIDNTGGINLYKANTNITPSYTVKEGDKIRVIGRILPTYYGLTEMGIDSITRLDSNQTLKMPLVVTTLDESTESNLIKLENLELVAVDTLIWPKVAGAAVSVNALDTAGNNFVIRIHDKCDLQGTTPPHNKFNITGLGNQYDLTSPYLGSYQIWPRYKADLTNIVSIQPKANKLGLEIYPNPNNGQFALINSSSAKLNISIFNTLGEEISGCVSSQQRINLNITAGKGLYIVKVNSNNGQPCMIKVIVK